eukprot:897954-Rhodomonas_salina.4
MLLAGPTLLTTSTEKGLNLTWLLPEYCEHCVPAAEHTAMSWTGIDNRVVRAIEYEKVYAAPLGLCTPVITTPSMTASNLKTADAMTLSYASRGTTSNGDGRLRTLVEMPSPVARQLEARTAAGWTLTVNGEPESAMTKSAITKETERSHEPAL